MKLVMNNPEKPKEEDLFEYSARQQAERAIDERDETDTCTQCRNSGFCPKHSVRPPVAQQPRYEVHSSDKDINEELQLAANRTGYFKTNEEALEYFRNLRGESGEGSDKRKVS